MCAWHNAELQASCKKPGFASEETSMLVDRVNQCSGGSLRGSIAPVLACDELSSCHLCFSKKCCKHCVTFLPLRVHQLSCRWFSGTHCEALTGRVPILWQGTDVLLALGCHHFGCHSIVPDPITEACGEQLGQRARVSTEGLWREEFAVLVCMRPLCVARDVFSFSPGFYCVRFESGTGNISGEHKRTRMKKCCKCLVSFSFFFLPHWVIAVRCKCAQNIHKIFFLILPVYLRPNVVIFL